jgi:enolase-phosphatase E1
MTIKAILTDVEGTTSAISFVKKTLFPYAREHMAEFVATHGDNPEVRALLEETCRMEGHAFDQEWAVQKLIQWIDEDRKAPPLKAIQGLIWEYGYENGDFQGHLYEDAYRGLKRWHEQGLKLYVFSSGSVRAQKLMFAHTAWGDLTPWFSGHFDTRTGPKQESASYRAIAEQIGLQPGEILFLSDVEAELRAAREAGMQTILLIRDVQTYQKESTSTFDSILSK